MQRVKTTSCYESKWQQDLTLSGKSCDLRVGMSKWGEEKNVYKEKGTYLSSGVLHVWLCYG